VGFLDSFERSVERLVGGAFAKAFSAGVHPVEIVAALKREMDSRASARRPEHGPWHLICTPAAFLPRTTHDWPSSGALRG
jgi:hypothetical protein